MSYYNYDDNELLSYVEEQDEDAKEIILKKYEPYIVNSAKKIYNQSSCKNGLEMSDLIQEGLVGLTNAIQTYNTDMNTMFYTYAKKCIDNHMISLAVQNNRKKNKVLNESLSLESLLDDCESLENILMKDEKETPEQQLIALETENEIMERIRKQLSDLETEIFDLRLAGLSYRDIAEFLDKDRKTVDNTLQRIKTKLKKVISEIESQD